MRTGSATIVLVSLIATAKNPTCTDWQKIKGALECASVARVEMDARADQQATIPRVIGAVLIPLSAAIAGLAMTGTTGAPVTAPVTALTLAGMATMGEWFWLSSPARRHAYDVGGRAVQCVITTMQPLEYLEGADVVKDLRGGLSDLPIEIPRVNAAISRVSELTNDAGVGRGSGDGPG